MQSMRAIWDRIEAWLKVQAPAVMNRLQPGATDGDIQQVEALLGVVLPEDLKASYRIHNGTDDDYALMDMWELLSLKRMTETWEMLSSYSEDGSEDEGTSDAPFRAVSGHS